MSPSHVAGVPLALHPALWDFASWRDTPLIWSFAAPHGSEEELLAPRVRAVAVCERQPDAPGLLSPSTVCRLPFWIGLLPPLSLLCRNLAAVLPSLCVLSDLCWCFCSS